MAKKKPPPKSKPKAAEAEDPEGESAAPPEPKAKKLSSKERRALQKAERQAAWDVEHGLAGATAGISLSMRTVKPSAMEHCEDIHAEGITMQARGVTILKDAVLDIQAGRRYGLVGPNGCGKSTILAKLASRELPVPESMEIVYVEQEAPPDDRSVFEAVLSSDQYRVGLLSQLDEINGLDEEARDEDKLYALHEALEEIEADSAPFKVRKVLGGLGFSTAMQDAPVKECSGGWRMRVALAAVLFLEPTLLLLDEPTNHLDLMASLWLADFLRGWKKTLVVVSHDQEFLNRVATDIIEVAHAKLQHYTGAEGEVYDSYKRGSVSRRKDLWRAAEQERLEEAKTSSKPSASKGSHKAKIAQSEETVLAGPSGVYQVTFPFPQPPELSRPIVSVDNVGFRYAEDKPTLFSKLSTAVTMDSRIAIVGPNGSGKSTLFKLLSREMPPTSGEVRYNPRLQTAVYNQHFIEQLPMDLSPVKHLTNSFPTQGVHGLRKALGQFGLPDHAHEIKIRSLSGGQKARLLFAQMALSKPDVMFLDEPTNHLDIESIDALVDAIKRFEGGVVIVSHDARLLIDVECVVWECGGCEPDSQTPSVKPVAGAHGDDPNPFAGVTRFRGSCQEYANHLLERFERDGLGC